METVVAKLETKIKVILEELKVNTVISRETRDQTIKTNGRVNALEGLNLHRRITDVEKDSNYLKGAIAIIVLIGGFSFYSYMQNFKREITDSITTDLVQKINLVKVGDKLN